MSNFIIALLMLFSTVGNDLKVEDPLFKLEKHIHQLYSEINFDGDQKPTKNVFEKGLVGYYNLKSIGHASQSHILSLVDFSLSGNKKRLWLIDMKAKKVLVHTYVSHGKNTGEEYAKSFSNKPNSYQSSLGFYETGEEYIGKHGRSLRLYGLETGINDKAFERAIVIHGAEYVSEDFIQKAGRLGRSQGCPAVPVDLLDVVIDHLAEKSILFIFHSDMDLENKSQFLDPYLASASIH